MNFIDNMMSNFFKPLRFLSSWFLRFGLGLAFIIHGYGKFPLPPESLMKYFGFPDLLASFVAISELTAGFLIIFGGFFNNSFGSVVTRFAALIIVIIMVFAFVIAHQDWFITTKLFTSEQIFLFWIGLYFVIKGNKN